MKGDREGTGESNQDTFKNIMLPYRYNIHIFVLCYSCQITKSINKKKLCTAPR